MAAPTTTSRQPNRSPSSSHLIAGAASGLVSCVLLQPLDVIKTRLQQPSSLYKQPVTCPNRHAKTLFLRLKSNVSSGITPIRVLSSAIIREHGPLGLWKGTAPTIVRNVPGSSLYFYLLDHFRYTIRQTSTFSPDTINLMSGASARGIAGFILMPISIIKVRFESNQYQYTSIVAGIKDIARNNGLRGLFTGFGVTAARDIPYAGIYVGLYERIKSYMFNPFASTTGSVLNSLAAGLVAGSLATILTHPFDLIKTRVQVDPQLNSCAAAKHVFRSEGVAGFFHGLSPRLLRKPLHAAITWATYEHIVLWIPS